MLTESFEILSAAVLGLGSHWGFFIHGEKDLKAANIARFHLLVAIGLIYFGCHFHGVTLQETLYRVLKIGVVYIVSILTSITIYRLFFSPLRHIQGPLHMSITKLTHVLSQAKHRNSEMLHALHKARGDIVRTGNGGLPILTMSLQLN